MGGQPRQHIQRVVLEREYAQDASGQKSQEIAVRADDVDAAGHQGLRSVRERDLDLVTNGWYKIEIAPTRLPDGEQLQFPIRTFFDVASMLGGGRVGVQAGGAKS